MKKIITNLTRLHKSRISGAAIYTAIGIVSVASIAVASNASALSYLDNVGVNFTFDQSLTVSLSSADIVINNLAPGSASDSNVIDVNVLSNNLSGYKLTSTVGNDTHTNPSYDNTNLNHAGNSSNTFVSLSPSDSVSDLSTYDTSGLTNPNVWGYSYSDQTVDNPTWSNYSGLPLYDTTGVTLKTSATPSAEGGDTIKFKIAAKASTSQPSGEYRNIINFTVTAEHNPVSFYDAFKEAATKDPTITTLNGYYKMQDMTADICNTIEAEESQMTLIDTRDHNVYTVAKLKDNRCWMTTNLNLKGSTQLSHEDTDMPEGYTLPVANGFQEGNRLPESSTEGFSDATAAYLYNSNRDDPFYCSSTPGCYSYYSWTAATVGSGLNITNGDSDARYSICSKGWALPRTTTSDYANSTAYKMLAAYGMNGDGYIADNSSNPTSSAIYGAIKDGTTPNFLATGGYGYSRLYNPGVYGIYWSATSADDVRGYGLYLSASYINSAIGSQRYEGFPVRCLANN